MKNEYSWIFNLVIATGFAIWAHYDACAAGGFLAAIAVVKMS